MGEDHFKPALLVVDFQEDFCPPNGSLAVAGGRAIGPVVNALLKLPFATKIATRDWHPADHVSFAANHPGAEPFLSTTTVANPHNPAETVESRLWPVHCVQDTPGAALVPELDADLLDSVLDKGTRPDIEMYSAFYGPFEDPGRIADSGLAERLRAAGITDVFVVGLAGDYCVKYSALHAASEGFRAVVVEEGTRCVDPGTWDQVKAELAAGGVKVVSFEGPEVERVRARREE
ncbi:hypothetical protein ACRALDRAFT_1075550 [Sodiomyces alcalophilus JCM 7366]|uniref:uncharacterized protein n=1 Tax=Sodiomyces alcalophilus JCM 7366 TaxID=591952 RepID=UPI0039B54B85